MSKVTVLVSLYRCIDFIESFLQHASAIVNKDEIEFLLLHNDPQPAETAIIDRHIGQFKDMKHIRIVEREGLYKTWNRGIKLATGDYITIWNVDDIRFPDSILRQAQALDHHPAAAVAYGDMYGSKVYGTHAGKLYQHPEWTEQPNEFFQSYVMSCFQMWRKSIHQEVGFYDEQFKCVGDFDFQVRVALRYPFVKVKEPLGIYLEDLPHKLSSSSVQSLENNIVYARYGAYKKIQLPFLRSSLRKYRRHAFLFFDQWVKNTEKSPFPYGYRFAGAAESVLRAPLYMARSIFK